MIELSDKQLSHVGGGILATVAVLGGGAIIGGGVGYAIGKTWKSTVSGAAVGVGVVIIIMVGGYEIHKRLPFVVDLSTGEKIRHVFHADYIPDDKGGGTIFVRTGLYGFTATSRAIKELATSVAPAY